MRLTGAARLAGVMGWPIAHSRSPQLHGHWLERYGAYVPRAVPPNGLEAGLRALPLSESPPEAFVADLVYVPLMTPLLLDAAARGNPVVDGALRQAVLAG